MNKTTIKKFLSSNLDPKVNTSINFITSNLHTFSSYDSLEELAMDYYDYGRNKAETYHFSIIRTFLIARFWENSLYVGVELVEELLFNAIKSKKSIIEGIASLITFNKINQDGIIIYPLHSFGINGAFERFLKKLNIFLDLSEFGILVQPQLNDKKKVAQILDESVSKLDVKFKLSKTDIASLIAHPRFDWLHKNPILLLKAKVYQWDYYSNHAVLKIKLVLTKAFIIFLKMTSSKEPEKYRHNSTAKINNWETFDFNHYIVLTPRKPNVLYPMSIPMNIDNITMNELSELNIDLDPLEWGRRSKTIKALSNTFLKIEPEIVKDLNSKKSSTKKNVILKLYRSIEFLLKSYRREDTQIDSIVNLAVAYETLLLDNYAPGIGKLLDTRLKKCLRGTKKCKTYWGLPLKLYTARCEIVHSGHTSSNIDLFRTQQAFCKAWLYIANNLHKLPNKSICDPINQITS